MGLIIQLAIDAFLFRYVWRAYKQYSKPQDKMYETLSDYQSRKVGALILLVVWIVVIILNHVLSNMFSGVF